MRRATRAALLTAALLACAAGAHAAPPEARDDLDALIDQVEAELEADGEAQPEAVLGDVWQPASLPAAAATQASTEGAAARAEAGPTCGSEAECLALCPRDNVLSSDATEKVVQEQVRVGGAVAHFFFRGAMRARCGHAGGAGLRHTASGARPLPAGRVNDLDSVMAGQGKL
jgi:hypothetical protein